MSVKMYVTIVGIGLTALAQGSPAALLSSFVKADLSGGTGSTPRLTTADTGTDPHGYGVNVNVNTNALDSVGVFGNVLSSSEYLGGTGNAGGGGVAASGGDTANQTNTGSTAVGPRSFTAPANTQGTLTVTGFAFASAANVGTSPFLGSNRAATLRVSVLWFGSDGAAGGTGSAADANLVNGTHTYVDVDATAYQLDTSDSTSSGTQSGGVYYVKLNPADYLTLNLTTNDGATIKNNFRVLIAPAPTDSASVRFKTNLSTNTTFSGTRLTVAGSFTPVPEPASLALVGLAGAALVRRRRGSRGA